jgi:hypothetical protein
MNRLKHYYQEGKNNQLLSLLLTAMPAKNFGGETESSGRLDDWRRLGSPPAAASAPEAVSSRTGFSSWLLASAVRPGSACA